MNSDIFKKIYEVLLKASPLITCLIFILFDSIPFYFFEFVSFKTQLGILCVYAWICCDNTRLRPFSILFFGVLIDLFYSHIFGITSLILILISLLQRSNYEVLLSKSFNITWIRFSIFICVYNTLNLVFNDIFLDDINYSFFEIAYSIITIIIIFPLVFSLVNTLNEKIKFIYE